MSEYAPVLPLVKDRHAAGRASMAKAVSVTGTPASRSPPLGVSSSRLPR